MRARVAEAGARSKAEHRNLESCFPEHPVIHVAPRMARSITRASFKEWHRNRSTFWLRLHVRRSGATKGPRALAPPPASSFFPLRPAMHETTYPFPVALTAPADGEHSRRSEASLVALRDGSVLIA